MEHVKHHVSASGNSTLRGFFGSANVDFDPPSLSLRENIKKAKCRHVYNLAAGATGDAEEDEIRNILAGSENSYELIRLMQVIGGWEELDNELPEGHLDPIATRIAHALDQRDYVVYQLLRDYHMLVDYGASPNLGDCFVKFLTLWPAEFRPAVFDRVLSLKGALLKGITSATMRDRTAMITAAFVHIGVVNQYIAAGPHRVNDLVALMHEVNYTTRICTNIARLQYRDLYRAITDMVDSTLTNIQRIACRDTFQRLMLEFSAAEKAVEIFGTNENRTLVRTFMLTLNTAVLNFPAVVPNPGVVGLIAAAFGAVADDVATLRIAIVNLTDELDAITIPNLFGSSDDDTARHLVSELADKLPHLAFDIKRRLVNALLSGATVDDDEIAINKVLTAAKSYDQAELYQLVASATWESLSTSMDGDQYDEMEIILHQPT